MAVTLSAMRAFVGAGSPDESALTEDLAQAVALLAGYLRHLRQTNTDGSAGTVAATFTETTEPTWTWADTRDLEPDALIPVAVLDRCTSEVCSDLFHRRNAPGGIINSQYAGADAVGAGPARLHRDPLIPAYPLLGRWAVPF